MISQIETVVFHDLETLDRIYGKFKMICEKYKDIMGDKFIYKLDPDYDKLELEITTEFTELPEDDYTEGDPQLN